MKITLTILMVIVVIGPHSINASDSEQDAIWALEEAYWTYLKEGDLESWNDQWHNHYVGWPHDSKQPIHRNDVMTLNEQVFETLKPGTFWYRLLPGEVVIVGDVAVAHYMFSWKATTKSGEKIYRAGKVTHTWYREDHRWMILSGMSAPPPSSALDVD